MFRGCTSLTAAPVLSATTLANACYYAMFDSCTSLSTAPYLPATTLAPSCYYSMFHYCTSLNDLTVNFTDWSTSLSATTNWTRSVNNNGTFTKPSELTVKRNLAWDWSYIPADWTVVNK